MKQRSAEPAIDTAAWDSEGVEQFTYFIGHAGTNVQSEYNPHNDEYPTKTPGVIMRERDTEVDTLDNIIRKQGIGKVDHINVTVNGTEYRVFQGMIKTLQSVKSVSFVYSNRYTVESPILEFLESQGLDVLIIHAPVSLRQKQFLVGIAAPKIANLLPHMVEESYEARFEYLREHSRVAVKRD